MSNLGFQTVYRLFNAAGRHRLRAGVPAAEAGARRAGSRRRRRSSRSSRRRRSASSTSSRSRCPSSGTTSTSSRCSGWPASRATPPSAPTRHPLVVIGGAVTFVNPEPLAPFADVIAAGEGEVLVPGARARVRRGDRAAPTCCGCSPPSAASTCRRSTSRSTPADGTIARLRAPSGDADAPRARPQGGAEDDRGGRSAGDEHLHARHGVRIALPRRGRARLREPVPLLLGRLQLPARARVSDRPHPAARRGGAPVRAAASGLVSIALCDHPDIERILVAPARDGLRDQPRVAAPRRPDRPDRPRCCAQSGERTITIAPETGSDRLRRVINKTVTNDEILDRADLIFASGIENLKLYYMIGLPTETDEDLVAIRDLTLQIRDRMLDARQAARPDRPHRRQRQPADPEAGHGVPVAADGRRGRHRSEDQAAARPDGRDRQRVLQHQVRAALLLSGAAVARRSARRAGHRGRRAERPELARRRGRGRRRRGLLPLPRPQPATRCCPGTSSTAA